MVSSNFQAGPILALGGVALAVFIFCVLPIVLGVMALRQIDRSGGAKQGRGLALIAILLGAMGLLVLPVLIFLGSVSRSSTSYSVQSASPAPAVAPAAWPSSNVAPGAGGAGGAGSWGGSPGGAGSPGSVIVAPPPAVSTTPATRPAPNASTAPRPAGRVGEQNQDDFGAVEKPEPPKAIPPKPAVPPPAPRRPTGGSVGEGNVDD